MEKYAWMAKIKPGMKDEYVRRHDEIWPELVELLKTAGIYNYTIWTDGTTLFGYYECEKGIEYATKTQAQSPIVDKWNEYMTDVMEMPLDPVTGAQPQLKKVFTLD
jgi:L-rhamnose mutarotase